MDEYDVIVIGGGGSGLMQTLDENGRPIPGLYAVGCNGIGGQVLWGHGLHIAWAITSGRLVGKHLANLRTADRLA